MNVTVTNVLGEEVLKINNLVANDIILDLSKLVVGTYNMECSSANSVVKKKVVKQ